MHVVFRWVCCLYSFCIQVVLQKSREIRRANNTTCIFRTYESFFSPFFFSSSYDSYRHHCTWLPPPRGLRAMTFSAVGSRKPLFEDTKPINITVVEIFRTRPIICLRLLTDIMCRGNFFWVLKNKLAIRIF